MTTTGSSHCLSGHFGSSVASGFSPALLDGWQLELPNLWTGAGFTATVIVWLGIGTLAILITTGALTLGKSVREYRADTRREEAKRRIRPAIRQRSSQDDPDWEAWVTELSSFERRVAADLVLDDLRILEGRQKDRLEALAAALDLDRTARADLESGGHFDRLRALDVLRRIEAAVEPDQVCDQIDDRRSEREAAAQLLAQQSAARATEVGLELLLQGQPMTVYGLDGLHALIGDDPAPVLTFLAERTVSSERLRSQALLVLAEAGVPRGDPPMDAVLEALENQDPVIRERACRVLGSYGWHPEVREALEGAAGSTDIERLDQLVTDPVPAVRTAAYWMLDEWGDSTARRVLAESAARETDDHARVQIARALQRQRPQSIAELKAEGTFSPAARSWADIRHVIATQPDPLR
jgi:hypothetical protein